MQHEFHDGVDWFTASTNTEQFHDVLVVKPLHQLRLTQEIQLQSVRVSITPSIQQLKSFITHHILLY